MVPPPPPGHNIDSCIIVIINNVCEVGGEGREGKLCMAHVQNHQKREVVPRLLSMILGGQCEWNGKQMLTIFVLS